MSFESKSIHEQLYIFDNTVEAALNSKQPLITDNDLQISHISGLQTAIDNAASSGGGSSLSYETIIQLNNNIGAEIGSNKIITIEDGNTGEALTITAFNLTIKGKKIGQDSYSLFSGSTNIYKSYNLQFENIAFNNLSFTNSYGNITFKNCSFNGTMTDVSASSGYVTFENCILLTQFDINLSSAKYYIKNCKISNIINNASNSALNVLLIDCEENTGFGASFSQTNCSVLGTKNNIEIHADKFISTGAITDNNQLATKQYVDDNGGGDGISGEAAQSILFRDDVNLYLPISFVAPNSTYQKFADFSFPIMNNTTKYLIEFNHNTRLSLNEIERYYGYNIHMRWAYDDSILCSKDFNSISYPEFDSNINGAFNILDGYIELDGTENLTQLNIEVYITQVAGSDGNQMQDKPANQSQSDYVAKMTGMNENGTVVSTSTSADNLQSQIDTLNTQKQDLLSESSNLICNSVAVTSAITDSNHLTTKSYVDSLLNQKETVVNVTSSVSNLQSQINVLGTDKQDLLTTSTNLNVNDIDCRQLDTQNLKIYDIGNTTLALIAHSNMVSANDYTLGINEGGDTILNVNNSGDIKFTKNGSNNIAHLNSFGFNIESGKDLYRGSTSLTTDLAAKQDSLIAGSNISIDGNTISATGGGGATRKSLISYYTSSGFSSISSGIIDLYINTYEDIQFNNLGITFTQQTTSNSGWLLPIGTYKIYYKYSFDNGTYGNRLGVQSVANMNGTDYNPSKSFGYSRDDFNIDKLTTQAEFIYTATSNTYMRIRNNAAKNNSSYNSNWDGISRARGSSIIIEKID